MPRGSLAAWLHDEYDANGPEVNIEPSQFFPRVYDHRLQSRATATSLVEAKLGKERILFDDLFTKVDDSLRAGAVRQTSCPLTRGTRWHRHASAFGSYNNYNPNYQQGGGYQQNNYQPPPPPQQNYQQPPPSNYNAPPPGGNRGYPQQQNPPAPGYHLEPNGPPPPPPGQHYEPNGPPNGQYQNGQNPNGQYQNGQNPNDPNAPPDGENNDENENDNDPSHHKGKGGKAGAILAGSTLPIAIAMGGAAVYFLFCRKKPQPDLGGDSASEMSDSDETDDTKS